MKAKTRFLAVVLLLCTLSGIMPFSAIVAWAEELSVTEKEDAMEAISGDNTLSAYKQGATQTVADDGYIGIPVEVTVYYDYSKGAAKPGYNGTPVILYVVNSGAERIGTDSDTDIIKSMLDRGYAVLVTDYKNHSKAVSPALEYSAQKIRTKAKSGSFFTDKTVFPSGTYYENHVCPAGHDVSLSNVFFELDKHGQDGGLEKIVEIWNYDFRGCKADTVIKWVYEDGTRKSTQNGWDGSEPVWYADAAGKTVDNANGQYIKVKHTWAKSITDCVKKDGTPIDLNLYMHIIYPTNPGYDVPVMTLACSSEHLAGGTANEARPYLVGFAFSGYAVSTYDFEYVPMSRDDHYGYFSGDASGGVTGINGTFALGAYNRSLYNTAAMRYLRYISINDHETFAFNNDKFGIFGNSKGGFKTFLGSEDAQGSMTLAELGEGATKADLENYVSEKASNLFREGIIVAIPAEEQVTESNGSASTYLTFDGGSRYENGKTETVKVGNVTIDGGELQPWLTYTDENGMLREIPCDVQWVYSSCGGNTNTITSKHAPLFTAANYYDSFGSGYTTHNYFANLMRIYDIPSMFFETPLEHSLVSGNDMDHGVDTYNAFFINAAYWLKDTPVSVAYTTPVQGDAGIKTTDDILIKFYGPVSDEEIEKVTVTDSKGNKAEGIWVSGYGKTEWSFKPKALNGGDTYTVTVPAELCGQNGKAMGADYTFTFGTEAELSADFTMTAPVTVTNENGTYFSFTAPAAIAEGYNSQKLRFRIANIAANTVNIYAATSLTDTSGKLLGSVNLKGDGYYEYDVSDYVMASAGKTVYFLVKTAKATEDKTIYTHDFEAKGDFWMNNIINPVFVTEVAGEEVTAVKATVGYGNSGKYGAKTYAGWYPVRMTNTKVINGGSAVTKADYGRTFTFTLRIYDTAERHLQLWFNDCTNGSITTGDYSYSRTVIKTKANQWMEVQVPYTVYEMDYGIAQQVKEFKVLFKSTGSTEMPIYIDNLTVVEHVTDAVITEAALVTASEGTKAYKAPESEAAFEVNGKTYNTWWDAICATSNLTYEQFSATPEKGTIKLLRNFVYDRSATQDIIASRATLKLDLNGYTITLVNGSLFNIASENATKLTYTVTNGTVIVNGVSPVINHARAKAAGNGKVHEYIFDNVDILNGDGTATPNLISSAKSPDGATVTQTIRMKDCNVFVRRSELPKTPCVIFPVGTSNISTEYEFDGGSINLSSFVKIQLIDNNTKLEFGAGSDGEQTKIIVPESVEINVSDSYMSEKGYSYLVAQGSENGYVTYGFESAKYSTKYGVIPEEYTPEEYPFAVFIEGEFIGVCKYFYMRSDSDLNNVFGLLWKNGNMRGETDKHAYVVLRRDYDMSAEAQNNGFDNVGQLGGNILFDLGGYKLTSTSSAAVIPLVAKYGYDSLKAKKDHIYPLDMSFINGTIDVTNAKLIQYNSMKCSTDVQKAKYDKAKVIDITFDDIDFVIGDKPFIETTDTANLEFGAEMTVKFNDCDFDLIANTAAITLFDGYDTSSMNDIIVYMNGGNITASSLANVTLANLNPDDKFFFGKNVNGIYPTLTVPTSYTLPSFGGLTKDGVGVAFGGEGKISGSNTVYSMQESTLVTKYGTIPMDYSDSEKYPFVVFSNGVFVAAFEKFVDNNDSDGVSYNGNPGVSSAMEQARAIVYARGGNAQILMRRNYTYTSSEGGYNNLAQLDGEVTIDLGGFTLTHNKTNPIFNTVAKQSWSSAQKKNVVLPTYIKLMNGKLVTKASLISFATIQSANYENGTASKHISYTFEDLEVVYGSGATYKALVVCPNASNNVHQRNAFFDITLNNCTFDITALSAVTVPFAIGADHLGTNLNNVSVKLNGGAVKTSKATVGLGAMDAKVGENGDSFVMGKGDNGYTQFITSSVAAPTVAFPTDKGEMYYGKYEGNTYRLGEKTKYGVIPAEYDAETYPFAVFKNGILLGAHEIWCQDNSPSAIYTARLGMIGKAGAGVTVTILVRRDYQITNADNYYNNMAHIGGTLVIDLDGHTFTVDAGKPMIRAKSQTVGDSSGTYVCDTAIRVMNGKIVTKGECVFQLSTEVIATRFENYIREKVWDITCENVEFVIPTGGRSVVTTTDTANHELGSVFNVTFNGCIFDVTAAKNVTVLDGIDTQNKNDVNFTVNGGKIIGADLTGIKLVDIGTNDTAIFGEYNGSYTTLTATAGVPDNQGFNTAGGIYTFAATENAGEYVLAPCTHSYDNELDPECNICGHLREVDAPVVELDGGTCGVSVSWSFMSDGTLVIYGNGSMADLEKVTDQPWAKYREQIKKVVIEEGVVSIGRSNFYNHTSIKEVVLPESLMSIEEYAFFGCTGLTGELTIPARVFYIGGYAFRKTDITKFNFENSENWTFGNGVALDLENAVAQFKTAATYTKICVRTYEQTAGEIIYSGTYKTFTWTVSNTGVLTIGGEGDMPRFGVSNAPWYAFRGAIRHIVIEDNVTSIGRCAFYGYKTLVGLEINAPIAKIGEYAFYNSGLLESVDIPASVVQIEPYAFRKTGLKVATFEIPYGWSVNGEKIDTAELAGDGAADSLKLAYFTKTMVRDVNAEPEEVDPDYIIHGMMNASVKWNLYWTDESQTAVKLVISGNGKMADFGTGAAPWYEEYRGKIVEVVVEEGVTHIGRCSFLSLTKLSKVTLNEGLLTIGDYAFNKCYALKEITIPTTVTSIGKDAFAKTGLKVNYNAPELMQEALADNADGVQIKLLGDSITHGVGGTGFQQNGENIIGNYNRNPDGYCWANLFADYMNEKYGATVVNNACTGRDIEFIINNFDKLVDTDDDLVIVAIGTNNRQQYHSEGEKRDKDEFLAEFYGYIIKLNSMFKEAGIRVVFVANIPASEANEQDGADYWRIFHMDDVNDTYKRASAELGASMISMYDLFNQYIEDNGVTLDSLLKDGLHPNDEGYRIMFELIIEALGV